MRFFKGAIRPAIITALLVIVSIGLYLKFNTTQVSVQPEWIQTPIANLPTKHVEDLTTTAAKAAGRNNEANFDFAALDLTLLAAIVANPINQSNAVIQANDLVTLYKLNDKIKQTELTIAAIYQNYIVLVLGNKEYELHLSANIDTDTQPIRKQKKPLDSEQTSFNSEQAKEIGNRPKELGHIMVITPATNGFYVSPGINPGLFRAAKFKEGDVLQTINGKVVNEPEALQQAKSLIASAQTLEFTVLRGGKLVTLYLDIPAQDLSISR